MTNLRSIELSLIAIIFSFGLVILNVSSEITNLPIFEFRNGIEYVTNSFSLTLLIFILFTFYLYSFKRFLSIKTLPLYLLAFFIPFKFINISFAGLSITELDLVLFSYIILQIFSNREIRFSPLIFLTAVILILVLIISSIMAENRINSFISLIYLIYPISAFFIFSNLKKTEILFFINIFYIFSFFAAIVALYISSSFLADGKFTAVAGVFKNSNSFGTYLSFSIFVGAYRIYLSPRLSIKILESIIYLIIIFAFIGSMSRSSYLGVFFGFLIYFFYRVDLTNVKGFVLNVRSFLAYGFTAFVLVALFPDNFAIEKFFTLLQSILSPFSYSSTFSSNSDRIILYSIAYDIFSQNIFFGSGTGSFREISIQYPMLSIDLYGYSAHSSLLQLLAENGLISLISLAFLLLFILSDSLKGKNLRAARLELTILCITYAFLVQSITNHSFHIAREALLFWMFLSFIYALRKKYA